MTAKSQQALARWARVPGRCPLCGGALATDTGLTCPKGHHFDLSRQGAVQLLAGTGNATTYDGPLFTARRRMLELDLFTPALEAALPLLEKQLGEGGLWLDAGCGEGWATRFLAERLPGRIALGLDLSPAGVKMAAAAYAGPLWTVGDLARLPLADGAARAVVNLLSPAHYREFGRVLGPEGLLLKWVPGPLHLRELREALTLPPGEESRAAAFFEKNCRVLGSRRVTHRVTVDAAHREDAAAMAPFAQHRRAELAEALQKQEQLALTCDLILLWGTVKERDTDSEIIL